MERQRLARCLSTAEQISSTSATVFPELCYQVAGPALPSRATRHQLWCTSLDKLSITTTIDPGQYISRINHNQLYFPNNLNYFHSPEVQGKIYLPTAPAVVERNYTLVNSTGEFFYNHINTDGKTFVMGIQTSVPTDSGDYWTLSDRTLTATCGINIDGFCQWWL